jgi:branched-chain amino acid transport system permease protein
MTAWRILRWSVLAAIGPLIAWLPTSALTQSLLAQATFSAIFALGVGLLLRQNGMVSPDTCWVRCCRCTRSRPSC